MLFRNPFRFGRSLLWKPAGRTTAIWSVGKPSNILNLDRYILDSIQCVDSYRETLFSNALLKSDEGRKELRQIWQRLLKTIEEYRSRVPLSVDQVTAVASSFSFGLDSNTEPAEEQYLLHNFFAYLNLVLDEHTYNKNIPSNLHEEFRCADGHEFGKPVWDFEYPTSVFLLLQRMALWVALCLQ